MWRHLLLTLFIILALIGAWHVAFPLLGGVIILGATVFGLLIAGIVIFCFAVLMVFLFSGGGLAILGTLFALWTFIAVILFPILFPILLPLFILYLFIARMARQKVIRLQNL